MRSTSFGLFSVLIGLMLLVMLLSGSSAGAQSPTPTVTPTPYISPTPSFWLGTVPIILPTAWLPPLPTPFNISYTPAPNLNPYNLPNMAGDLAVQAPNMRDGIFRAMGPLRDIFNAAMNIMILFGCLSLMFRIIRRVSHGEYNLRVGGDSGFNRFGKNLGENIAKGVREGYGLSSSGGRASRARTRKADIYTAKRRNTVWDQKKTSTIWDKKGRR